MSTTIQHTDNPRPAGKQATALPPDAALRMSELDAQVTYIAAQGEGDYQRSHSLNERAFSKQGDIDAYKGRCREAGHPPDADHLADLEADLKRVRDAIALAGTASGNGAWRNGLKETRNAVLTFARGADKAKAHAVKPPQGKDIDGLTADLGALQAERQDVEERSIEPKSDVWYRIQAEVEALAAKGEPTLRRTVEGAGLVDKRRTTVKLNWPLEALPAAPLHANGEIPVVVNAAALIAWAAKDAILDALRLQLDAIYAQGVEGTVIMDAGERAKRLRDLDADILHAQRLVAEAAWEKIRTGDGDAYRHLVGLPPRAILGIA